jgi:type VI secretion system secreted protein Hcp
MAYEFYVKITGTTQTKIEGECIREGHTDKIAGISYRHEITAPRDINTGRASGARQHGPVIITKEWGAASPQLFQALVTNEELASVEIEFYQTDKKGQAEKYYTVKLIGATVSRITQSTGGGLESAGSTKTASLHDTLELEEVAFTYSRIEVAHVVAQTSAIDDWLTPR